MGVTNGADKRAGEWKKQHNTGTGMHQGKVRVSRNSRCSGGGAFHHTHKHPQRT